MTNNARAIAPITICPMSTNGQHDIEWLTVPESVHDGDLATIITPSYERGFCWSCDERFIADQSIALVADGRAPGSRPGWGTSWGQPLAGWKDRAMTTGLDHPMTVAHFNAYTGRWHVEETATTGEVWSTDFETANALAVGYRANGFESVIITAAQLRNRVENLPHGGSLVAELGMFED